MEIAMQDRFMPGLNFFGQPSLKGKILADRSPPMMVRNDQERSLVDSQLPELNQDLLAQRLRQGRNVMNGNDQTFHGDD